MSCVCGSGMRGEMQAGSQEYLPSGPRPERSPPLSFPPTGQREQPQSPHYSQDCCPCPGRGLSWLRKAYLGPVLLTPALGEGGVHSGQTRGEAVPGARMPALCPEEGVGICQIGPLRAQDRWVLRAGRALAPPSPPQPAPAAAEGLGHAPLSRAQPPPVPAAAAGPSPSPSLFVTN